MSSTQEGSSDMGRVKEKKSDKTRKSWTHREEDVLLHGLKELVAQGWKSDNGFRPGYLLKLEEVMKKEFSGTDLKGMPHINSKISTWKKNYYSLFQMLSRSGVGFNLRGNHMIDCEQDLWDQILKADANARLMRFKSWPYYDDWKEVFGKDRATGEGAEDVLEIINGLGSNQNPIHCDIGQDYNVNLDDIFNADAAEDSVCQGNNDEQMRKKKTKSKAIVGLDSVVEILGEISRNTNDRLEKLVNKIGYDRDLDSARKEVFDRLSIMETLTMDQKLDACELVAAKVERLEIFLGLPEDARARFVMRLLEGRVI